MVLLVALGLWADDSGRREILDGELAEGETRPDWQWLLDRRWQRGVRPEAGLQAVIRDGKGEPGAAVAQVYGTHVIEERGVFHKLRNVADKAREDLGGEAHHFTAGTHQSRIAPQVSTGCCFSSRRGALVAIYLQMQWLHARWTKTSWAHTARSLSLAFY